MSELEELLAFAAACADVADAISMRAFRHELNPVRKSDSTYVTDADTAIERALRDHIGRTYPGHGILGEEFAAQPGDGETRWIIDPIDATHSFLRGIPVFATLIALERAGQVMLGVVSAPAMGQRWHALKGAGAWCGSRRLKVSAVERLEDAQVFYASRTAFADKGLEDSFDEVVGQAWRDRGFGDFWGYMLVAEGSGEVMMEPELAAWDLAAPLVIVEEAGGRLTDLSGSRRLDGGTALATNGLLHRRVLECFEAKAGQTGGRRARA